MVIFPNECNPLDIGDVNGWWILGFITQKKKIEGKKKKIYCIKLVYKPSISKEKNFFFFFFK